MEDATPVVTIVGAVLWLARELGGRWLTERNLKAVATGIAAAKAALDAARNHGWTPRDVRVVDDIADRLERAGLRGSAMTKAFEVAERELALAMLHQAFQDLGRRVEEFKSSSAVVPIEELVRRKRASAPPDTHVHVPFSAPTTPVTVDLDAPVPPPVPPRGVIK